MTVSSSPHGEHPGRPGTTWETEPVPVEVWVPDHDDNQTDTPRPNRATRRAHKRAARRNR